MWGRIVVTTVALVAASGEVYSDIAKLLHFSVNRRRCLVVETRQGNCANFSTMTIPHSVAIEWVGGLSDT